jgi:hypothetical protein
MTSIRRRANPRTLGTLAGVLVVAALAAAFYYSHSHTTVSSGHALRDGPLATDGQDIEGEPTAPGARVAYAGLTLFNLGTRPIVLESAALDPAPRGLPQLGAYIIPPGRTLNAVEFIPWPHESDPRLTQDIKRERPLAGAVLKPSQLPDGQGAEVLLVFRPPAGTYHAPYVLVRYRVGHTQYTERLPRGVFLCAVSHPAKTYNCGHSLPQTIDRGSILGG